MKFIVKKNGHNYFMLRKVVGMVLGLKYLLSRCEIKVVLEPLQLSKIAVEKKLYHKICNYYKIILVLSYL